MADTGCKSLPTIFVAGIGMRSVATSGRQLVGAQLAFRHQLGFGAACVATNYEKAP